MKMAKEELHCNSCGNRFIVLTDAFEELKIEFCPICSTVLDDEDLMEIEDDD